MVELGTSMDSTKAKASVGGGRIRSLLDRVVRTRRTSLNVSENEGDVEKRPNNEPDFRRRAATIADRPPIGIRVAAVCELHVDVDLSNGEASGNHRNPLTPRLSKNPRSPPKRSVCSVPEEPPASDLSSSSATTTDSAVSSTAESRRGSSGNGFDGKHGAAIRPRRSTVNGKLPASRSKKSAMFGAAVAVGTDEDLWRKVSIDSQFDDNYSDDEQQLSEGLRRMSVDEKTLRNANYAILRKSVDMGFEIVGAFKRNEVAAYRSYLQSLTVYDILPQHGIVLMISSELCIRKAIHAMCSQQTQQKAAITINDGNYNIFTLSDFLHCLQLRRDNPDLGDRTLQQYFDEFQTQKRVAMTADTTSVWDVARMFRMNHVHRIPIFEVQDLIRTNEILGIVSLRPIFAEILKLIDSKAHLSPNLDQLALGAAQLGSRSHFNKAKHDLPCSDAIDILLEKRISCLPLMDDDGEQLVAVLTKTDILDAMAVKGEAAIEEIMKSPSKEIADPQNLIQMIISPSASIATAIRQLTSSNHQCLLLVDEDEETPTESGSGLRLVGVVSYADIMDFLIRCDKSAT